MEPKLQLHTALQDLRGELQHIVQLATLVVHDLQELRANLLLVEDPAKRDELQTMTEALLTRLAHQPPKA